MRISLGLHLSGLGGRLYPGTVRGRFLSTLGAANNCFFSRLNRVVQQGVIIYCVTSGAILHRIGPQLAPMHP